MKWVELSVPVDKNSVAEVMSVMAEHGYGGAVVDEFPASASAPETFIVKVYLPCNRWLKARKQQLVENLKKIDNASSLQIKEHLTGPDEWLTLWKSYFQTTEIGKRIIIKPSWREWPSSSTRKVIELDPGMAFGTGLHPTTRLCLLGIEEHLEPGMSVLDLGTGSGILAIAAARLGASSVLALDTDPIAVKVAKDNVTSNSVATIVKVRKGTIGAQIQKQFKNHFNLIVANITSDIIAGLALDFTSLLKTGGRLIVSGISDRGLDKVLISLTMAGFTPEAINNEEQWYAVVASLSN